ncbi:MAG: ubiquinone/menaquinone biosynthesis C-methylase UbiE [Planctomycetota bacterium]
MHPSATAPQPTPQPTPQSIAQPPQTDLTTQTVAARYLNVRLSLLSKIDRALEDVDRLVPLDDDRYHKTHEAFEARSNQRERILAWLCDHSGKVATRPGDLRVLSIGCGDGSVDLPTARTLGDKADHIHFAALDPKKAQLTQLEKAFADAALSNVTLTTHAKQLGDFDASERFDHIHCVHSFYYMPDPATALKQAIEMLADDGELLLFHAPCEDLNSLSARFYNKYYERTTPFAEDFATLLDGGGGTATDANVSMRASTSPRCSIRAPRTDTNCATSSCSLTAAASHPLSSTPSNATFALSPRAPAARRRSPIRWMSSSFARAPSGRGSRARGYPSARRFAFTYPSALPQVRPELRKRFQARHRPFRCQGEFPRPEREGPHRSRRRG